MKKEIKQIPEELSFVAYVIAAIAKNNYEQSVALFMDGIEKIIVSKTEITSEQFAYYVSIPLRELINYKLKQHLPRPDLERSARLECSFCGKGESEVKQLIAGPDIYICDACVGICNNILERTLTPE